MSGKEDFEQERGELIDELGVLVERMGDARSLEEARGEVVATIEVAQAWAQRRCLEGVAGRLSDVLERAGRAASVDELLLEIECVEDEIQALGVAIRSDAVQSDGGEVGDCEVSGTAPGPDYVIDDPEMVAEFLVEAREHQSNLDLTLLTLEGDPTDAQAFDSAYRSFHTMKGMAGFLQLGQCQSLVTAAESVLDRTRSGELPMSQVVIDLLLDTSSILQGHIEALNDALEEGRNLTFDLRFPPLIERLNVLLGGEQPDRLGEVLVSQGVVTPDVVEEALRTQERGGHQQNLGEILVKTQEVPAKEVAKGLRSQRAIRKGTKVEATVRVPSRRLDELGEIVGELTVLESMIQATASRSTDERLKQQLSEMRRILTRLHDLAGSLRAVPIRGLFEKMTRLARDVARSTDKQVVTELVGADTEIDKSVVDALSDPLVHLIRNGVDHGIEPPEERLGAGKAEAGRLVLRAAHQAGDLVIEVEDDGKGLDPEALRAKAIEKGVLDPTEVLSEEQCYALIFRAGFSTRANVSDLSGRGVGMDVVAQAVSAQSGRIDIQSRIGAGTKFSLRFPLTMAVLDGLVVRVAGQRLAIPIRNVIRSVRPAAGEISTVLGGSEVYVAGSQLYPVVDIQVLFGFDSSPRPRDEGFLVLVEAQDCRRALVVDDVLGQQRVVLRALGEGIGKVPGISGAAVMPDGKVGLIIDAKELGTLDGTGAAERAVG